MGGGGGQGVRRDELERVEGGDARGWESELVSEGSGTEVIAL